MINFKAWRINSIQKRVWKYEAYITKVKRWLKEDKKLLKGLKGE